MQIHWSIRLEIGPHMTWRRRSDALEARKTEVQRIEEEDVAFPPELPVIRTLVVSNLVVTATRAAGADDPLLVMLSLSSVCAPVVRWIRRLFEKMPFAWQVSQDRNFRYLLYGLSLISLSIASVFIVIGFVKFELYTAWYNGSFVGGWITSVCIFYILMSLTVVFGLRFNHMPLLSAFLVYNVSSLVIRILTVILFSVHNVSIEWTSWVLGASEIIFSLTVFSIMTVIVETGGIAPTHRSNRPSTKKTAPATVSATTSSNSGAKSKNDVEANNTGPKPGNNPFESPTESTEILRY